MRSTAAALTLFSGQVLGHAGAEGHFHGLGIEHLLLFVVMAGVLVFAVRK